MSRRFPKGNKLGSIPKIHWLLLCKVQILAFPNTNLGGDKYMRLLKKILGSSFSVHLLDSILNFLVGLYLKFGKIFVIIYRRIWSKLNIEWYNNYYSILSFIDCPFGLERYILADFFVDFNSNILDVGCGDGTGCKLLSRKAKKIIGFDINKDVLKLASKRFRNIEFSNKMPNGKFDLICCFSVLLFLTIEERKEMLYKIKELLADNGTFICSMTYIKDDAVSILNNLFQVKTMSNRWNETRTETYFICKFK